MDSSLLTIGTILIKFTYILKTKLIMKTVFTILVVLFALNLNAQSKQKSKTFTRPIYGDTFYQEQKNLESFLALPGIVPVKIDRSYNGTLVEYRVTTEHKEHLYRYHDNEGNLCTICKKPEPKQLISN